MDVVFDPVNANGGILGALHLPKERNGLIFKLARRALITKPIFFEEENILKKNNLVLKDPDYATDTGRGVIWVLLWGLSLCLVMLSASMTCERSPMFLCGGDPGESRRVCHIAKKTLKLQLLSARQPLKVEQPDPSWRRSHNILWCERQPDKISYLSWQVWP